MELTITFENPQPTTIPIDYQYYLSSWLYSVIEKGDDQYADFLHNQGYEVPLNKVKVFKLYNFSNLILQDFRIMQDKIQVNGREIKLKVRFAVDQALETFILGIFKGHGLQIKTGFNEMVHFPILRVESKPVELSNDNIKVKMLSPLVVAKKQETGHDLYLAPNESDFEHYFFINLLDKYIAAGGFLKSEWANTRQSITLLNPNKMRSKLIKVKTDSKSQTQVRGYMCELELYAPAELLKIGLLAGFGKENAMGFGYGDII
jgi:CRISPR-associated endoribonuclease Cas6